jgi:hypothetical protein
VLAAFVYGYFVGYRVALHPGDRELCVTVDDLLPLPGGAVKLPAHEKLERLFHTDGSKEVTYEYDASGEAHPLFLSSGVSESTSDRDARTEFVGRQAAVGLGSLVSGTKLDEMPRDDLLRWGDESRSTLLTVKGEPAGNYFLARKGSRLFSLILTGVYLDKPESLRAVVLPHLERMERVGL